MEKNHVLTHSITHPAYLMFQEQKHLCFRIGIVTLKIQATNTSTSTNYANVTFDLLPYNMESAKLTIENKCKPRHCALMYTDNYTRWRHNLLNTTDNVNTEVCQTSEMCLYEKIETKTDFHYQYNSKIYSRWILKRKKTSGLILGCVNQNVGCTRHRLRNGIKIC